MPKSSFEPRIALYCSPDGAIEKIVHNDFSNDSARYLQQPFYRIVDSQCLAKAGHFIKSIQQEGVALTWEMNLAVSGEPVLLHFSGSELGGKFVIVGAKSPYASLNLIDDTASELSEVVCAREDCQLKKLVHAGQAVGAEIPYANFTEMYNDLAKMQRDLIQKNLALKSLNQQKNQLLGMAAHDLRNPLGVILTFSKFLARELDGAMDAKQKMFVQKIQQSSEFMLHLINDLLHFSKIESGELSLTLGHFCLQELIESAVELARPLAQQKQIAIEASIRFETTGIEADRHKLEQVLNNLLSNAIKFSHAESTIHVYAYQREEQFFVSVIDQGMGIPPEKQRAIFQPFHNQGQEGTAGEKSTGLGLAICQRIVRGHNGVIHLESESGQGSVFTIELPMRQPFASSSIQVSQHPNLKPRFV